jgi:hypothetical protein
MKRPQHLSSAPAVYCQECGAENLLPATRCWLCYRPLNTGTDIVTAEVVGTAPPRAVDRMTQIVFSVMTIGVVGLTFLVGIGVAINERALLIPYGIVVLPALIATGVSLLRHRESTGAVSWQRGFLTLVLSFGITVGVLVLITVAMIVGLFFMCLHEITRH